MFGFSFVWVFGQPSAENVFFDKCTSPKSLQQNSICLRSIWLCSIECVGLVVQMGTLYVGGQIALLSGRRPLARWAVGPMEPKGPQIGIFLIHRRSNWYLRPMGPMGHNYIWLYLFGLDHRTLTYPIRPPNHGQFSLNRTKPYLHSVCLRGQTRKCQHLAHIFQHNMGKAGGHGLRPRALVMSI